MVKKYKVLISLFFFISCSSLAQVIKVSVSDIGTATTRETAIAAALVNASGQAFGLKIESSSVFKSSSFSSSKSDNSSGIDKTSEQRNDLSSLNEYISQKVKTPDNSPILGYTIDSIVLLPSQLWEAKITMTYSKFKPIGGDSTRRSVVIVAADPKNKDLLINAVSQSIVGTRQFDVLNRQNSALIDQEKNFILGSDAAQGEVARLGQASGADYLIVAELQSLSVSNNQQETIRLTGEVLVRSSASGLLKLQILEFSTRKIKWSGTEKFGGIFAGSSSVSNETLIKLITGAADKLVEKMVVSIYPIEINTVMSGNIGVLNRGEGSINKGESYAVFLIGEELKDKRTGESLGVVEIEVGTGKIVDVKPKTSYLKMDSGTLDKNAEYLVRKLGPQTVKPSPASSKNKENNIGGVSKSPFLN